MRRVSESLDEQIVSGTEGLLTGNESRRTHAAAAVDDVRGVSCRRLALQSRRWPVCADACGIRARS